MISCCWSIDLLQRNKSTAIKNYTLLLIIPPTHKVNRSNSQINILQWSPCLPKEQDPNHRLPCQTHWQKIQMAELLLVETILWERAQSALLSGNEALNPDHSLMWLGEELISALKTGNWCQFVDSPSVKVNTPYIYVYQVNRRWKERRLPGWNWFRKQESHYSDVQCISQLEEPKYITGNANSGSQQQSLKPCLPK